MYFSSMRICILSFFISSTAAFAEQSTHLKWVNMVVEGVGHDNLDLNNIRRSVVVVGASLLKMVAIDDTVKDKHLSLLVAFTLFSVIGVLSEAQLCNTWLIYLSNTSSLCLWASREEQRTQLFQVRREVLTHDSVSWILVDHKIVASKLQVVRGARSSSLVAMALGLITIYIII
uniref:Uncharacterized protein n=1 Tax=Solanum lycopersicum TaxID=4081 RepID=A0A3Q7GYB5_SOLLC